MNELPPKICELEDEPGFCELSITPNGIDEVEARIAKHGLSIISKERAIFDSNTNECIDLLIKIEGKKEDIQFALEDCVKLIRPYPKK